MNRLLFYNKFHKAVVCVLLIIVAVSMFTNVTFSSAGFATTESYDLGNYVGCNDAKIADPSDRYINQPGKGPSFHTNEFMDGYNDGVVECSTGTNSTGTNNTDSDDNSTLSGCDYYGGGNLRLDCEEYCSENTYGGYKTGTYDLLDRGWC